MNRISVSVAGKKYQLVSDGAPEQLEKVAAYVDREITETMKVTRAPLADVAVLTALNLADELTRAKEESRRLRMQIEQLRDSLPAKEQA